MRLLALVPAYNEEGNIEKLIVIRSALLDEKLRSIEGEKGRTDPHGG
ncbi:MAG: hypothetical protein KAU49_02495 [Candidatus Krumholzibacteria bacterium]|nr:hypothetical protein [Candidatus Krumholzibacteria bacterium]